MIGAAWLYVGYDRMGKGFGTGANFERDAGGGEAEFPALRISDCVEIPAQPGVTAQKVELAALGNEDPVVNFRIRGQELRDGDIRIRPVGLEEFGDIQSEQVDSTENAVVIFTREMPTVPALKMIAENHAELDVDMSPLPVEAGAGVSHLSDFLPGPDLLSRDGGGRAEVSIEGKKWTLPPVMMNDHVFAVVAQRRGGVDVNDGAVGDRSNFIEGISAAVATHRPDVDPFVKTGVNDPDAGPSLVSRKAVGSPFPGL